jgi:hypothetical protein
MATGQKTGGRAKGTPNKRTAALRLGVDDLLAKYSYDPLEAMIAEASDASVDAEVRRSLHGSIAPYIYPKLRSVEATVESSQTSTIQLTGMTDDQLLTLVLETLRDEDLKGEIERRREAHRAGLPVLNP